VAEDLPANDIPGWLAPRRNGGFLYRDRVDDRASGETLLDFYARRYRHSDRETWRERICEGAIRVDGSKAEPERVLRPGEILVYEREPWQEPGVPGGFRVLHEDIDVLAVDKPSGLPVLPGGHHLDHTLLALVRARCGGDVPPSPLHRLGRATSGIVLFARTERARRALTAAFAARRVTKLYLALVQGLGMPAEQTIHIPIGPVPYAPTGTLHAASTLAAGGKPSTSVCRVLHEDRDNHRTLVEVRIITGRPHQIRIHAAAIGHPLVGDPLYVAGGGPAPLVHGALSPLPGDCGYHLHAWRIAFAHPFSSEPIEITSPPPESLRIP
jgi:23S rRNA pseudouridine1911/1915/1917 synthase